MGIGLDILHPVTIVPMGGANVGSGSGEPIIVNLDYMQDTAPSNPQEKQVWYDTANNEIYTYKNGQWVESDPSVGVWYKFGDKYYLWDGNSLEETDLNIYEKIENKTSNFDTQSLITYPNSKALYDALQSQLATLTTFENKTGTVLETGLTLGNSVLVFINGSLLEAGAEADYIINGSQIIFSIPLQSTDKVGVINGNLRAIDLSPYQLKLGATNVITTGEGNVVGSVTADSGTVTVTKTTIEASTDYNDLDNKPSINGVTLNGNKTSNQLELQNMSIEIQNSGDTLPADTTGYNLGDKFLNKTDKKVYEVSNEYELNSNTNTSGLTINYTTGEVSGFGSGKYIYRNYTDGWLGNKNFIVKFKLDTISSGGLITISRRDGVSSPSDINIAFGIYTDNKIYYSKYSSSGSSYTEIENKLLFDIVLSANNEYVLNINKHGEICNVELLLNNTIIATNSFNTEDLTQYSINAIRFGNFYLNNNNYYLTTGSIYLLESSGDFLITTGNVVWDSGTALVDNTQYIDVTNDILWLYNDNKLIQLNSLVATINFYDVNNWTLDVTKTQLTVTGTLGNSVFVFRNGQLIQGGSGNDYTVSGNVITFTTALEDTDKIAVINGNLTGIDLTPYLTASDLVPYQQKAQIIEDSSATPGGNDGLAIQANKVYKFTNANISQIKFASCEQSELITKIDFTTGATAPQFIDNSNIDWADSETPHFYSYQHYWIIISNGVGFVKEIY